MPNRLRLLTLACLAVAAAGDSAWAIEFPGVKLAMTLAEFRNVRFSAAAGAKIVCEHDREARDRRPTPEMVATGAEAKAGVLGCGFFRFGRALGPTTSGLPAEWIAVPLKADGDVPVAATFWFMPAGGVPAAGERPASAVDTTQRLFRITLRANAAGWDKLWRATTARLGQPTFTTREPFSRGPGGTLDNTVATWDDGTSTLTATKRATLAERSTLEYLNKELSWSLQGILPDRFGN